MSVRRVFCWVIAASAAWAAALWIVTALALSGCGPLSPMRGPTYLTVRVHGAWHDFQPHSVWISEVKWGHSTSGVLVPSIGAVTSGVVIDGSWGNFYVGPPNPESLAVSDAPGIQWPTLYRGLDYPIIGGLAEARLP